MRVFSPKIVQGGPLPHKKSPFLCHLCRRLAPLPGGPMVPFGEYDQQWQVLRSLATCYGTDDGRRQ